MRFKIDLRIKFSKFLFQRVFESNVAFLLFKTKYLIVIIYQENDQKHKNHFKIFLYSLKDEDQKTKQFSNRIIKNKFSKLFQKHV